MDPNLCNAWGEKVCLRVLSGLRDRCLPEGSGVSGLEACTSGLVGGLYVKLVAREAFDAARDLVGRDGGSPGGVAGV